MWVRPPPGALMIEQQERNVNFYFDGPLFGETVQMVRHSYVGDRFRLEKVTELPISGFEKLKVLKRDYYLREPKVAQTSLEELAKEINTMTIDFKD